MVNWLSRATGVFREPPLPAPEPFNVRCDCGGFVMGDRVSAAQRPACPDCGRPIFVLPANVYPVPVKPKKKEEAGKSAGRKTDAGRGNGEKTDAGKAEGVKGERTGRVAPTGETPSAKPDRRAGEAAATAAKPPVVKPEGILLESRTRILTPFRIIVAAMVVMGSITAWGLWHRQRVESAKALVLGAHEAGIKALQEGDFVTAARELTRARNAVDLLHRTDPEANAIRRSCREAVAGHELSHAGLFELLADYAADAKGGKGQLASRHRDSWLVLDAVIVNPEATDRPCVLDMPLLMDGRRFRIEVDSPAVRNAARREQATGLARVIFAAPMSAIRPPSAEEPETTLVLVGKSAFLWTSIGTYTTLGYVEDREDELQLTRDLLARQLEQGEASP